MQTGFIIGVGLLLDTFVVRTITVPAMAVLVGKANWWPAGRAAARKGKIRRTPVVHDEDRDDHVDELHAVESDAVELDAVDFDDEQNDMAELDATVIDETDAVDDTAVDPLGDICDADARTIVEPVRTLRHYPLDAEDCQDNWLAVPADASSFVQPGELILAVLLGA